MQLNVYNKCKPPKIKISEILQRLKSKWHHTNSSVQKSNGFGMIPPKNITDFAIVKILVLLHHAVGWSTSIWERIFVLIPKPLVELKNGMALTKSEPL